MCDSRSDSVGHGHDTYRVHAVNKRGSSMGWRQFRAESEEDALEQFEEYDGYEVRVRHENGGTEWVTVFQTSDEKARREAFESELEYVDVLDVEPLGVEYDADARRFP